jgi:hypothetical protein
MSRRVRITAKRRDEIDIEKLALALLGLIREMERKRQETPGGVKAHPKAKGSAA